MNFSLQDIDFSSSISNWFDSFKKCPRLHHMFFGTEVNNDMYEDMRAMYYVFGLEAYHRQNFSQYHMEKDKYRKNSQNVIEQIPDVEAKPRMKNVIESLGNEPSLKTRLMNIFTRHNNLLSSFFHLKDTARQARILDIISLIQ